MEKDNFTFRERLVIEAFELNLKINGLKQFIEQNPMFKNLSLKMRMLMRFQCFYMKRYKAVLHKRMDILNVAKEEETDIITAYTTPKKETKKETKSKTTKNAKTKKD